MHVCVCVYGICAYGYGESMSKMFLFFPLRHSLVLTQSSAPIQWKAGTFYSNSTHSAGAVGTHADIPRFLHQWWDANVGL